MNLQTNSSLLEKFVEIFIQLDLNIKASNKGTAGFDFLSKIICFCSIDTCMLCRLNQQNNTGEPVMSTMRIMTTNIHGLFGCKFLSEERNACTT